MSTPTVLLFGHQGQVAYELRRSLLGLGNVVVSHRHAANHASDLTQAESIRSVIQKVQPDVIVNAAAYTAVDAAETDQAAAMAINAEAPGVMAACAAEQDALLIHYSTDYVFDGQANTAYTEDHPCDPQGMYGLSKWKGEEAITQTASKYLIFRTAWVYANRGKNFLLTMQRLGKEREALRVVDDQIGTPTWARNIADATCQAAAQFLLRNDSGLSGIYHLTNSGQCSWYDFASAIIAEIPEESRVCRHIEPIPSSEYPTPAKRPAYSVLSNDKLQRHFGIALPDWRTAMLLSIE